MVDTSIPSRAITYRDPTISAAAEAQLRRNRQQSFERLVDQAQRTTSASVKLAQVNQDLADQFQAAQDAAEQAKADESKTAAKRQSGQARAGAGASKTGDQQLDKAVEQQSAGPVDIVTTQPAATFSAQQISQEQLGIGLHVPPLQPADEAYRRAGAEPPLETEETTSVLMAVAV
jgi:hypothetical protein